MTTRGTTLGGLSIPLAPTPRGETPADPALSTFARYLTAILRTYAGAAWTALAPAEPIVRKYFTHDPEEYEFVDKDLPALYLFRTGSAKQIEQFAEDWRVHHDGVRIFWVLPYASQDKQAERKAFLPAVGKLIDSAFDRGRDPAFVAVGDPDPTAARQGSVVQRIAGVEWAIGREWKPLRLAIRMRPGEGEQRVYDALDFKLEIAERIKHGFEDLSSPSALDVKVAVDGTTVPPDFVDVSEFRSS